MLVKSAAPPAQAVQRIGASPSVPAGATPSGSTIRACHHPVSPIQGEPKKLGHRVGKTTIATTREDRGVQPSPDRPTSWRTFLKAHADVICGADFFTVEVWTKRGLGTRYVLLVIQHATRRIEIAGVTTHPNAEFMSQVARNLTDQVDDFLRRQRYLIIDNDSLFTKQFDSILDAAGVTVMRTAI